MSQNHSNIYKFEHIAKPFRRRRGQTRPSQGPHLRPEQPSCRAARACCNL